MPSFAIMDVQKGVRQDMTTIKLAKAFSPESENVYMTKGKVKRMKGRATEFTNASVQQAVPDGFPIIHYHLHNDVRNDIEYIFVFTKSHIYRWNTESDSFVLFYTSPTADVELWDTVDFDDKIIATSNKDLVQVWSDGGTGGSADVAFADLDSASGLDLDGAGTFLTRAKYVTVYENYLHLGYTTEDSGTIFKDRRRHSAQGDPTDFDETGVSGTGAKDFIGRGEVKGFAIYTANAANLLITFTKDGVKGSIQTSWLTTDELVFENNEVNSSIGLLATHSVVNDDDGNVYYWATDYTIRKLFDPNVLSNALEDLVGGINQTLQDNIEASFIDEFNWLAWSLPESDSSTGNDRVIYYDLNETRKNGIDIWYRASWTVRAFGSWTRQETLSIDGLDALYSTIDTIGLETIDSVAQRAGFPLDLVSDYSGNSFTLHQAENDAGSDFTGTLIIVTDFSEKGSPIIFKRVVEGISHIYNAESTDNFTVTHSYKQDDDGDWQGSDSLNLEGTGEFVYKFIPYDLRSRLFKFRQQATNKFEWNGLVINQFIFDGMQ